MKSFFFNVVQCTILCLFLCAPKVEAKVLLFTYAYNKPEFIELQYLTFKKFLQDEHELVVFNDARDPVLFMGIEQMCKKYNLQCYTIPQEIHAMPFTDKPAYLTHDLLWIINEYQAPSVRNCNVAQYSLDNYGFESNDIVALLDSDLFLIKEFSIEKYMKDHVLAGYDRIVEHPEKGTDTHYLWIGLIFMNTAIMPNKNMFSLNCAFCNNVLLDSGGQTHYYIKENPTVSVKYFNKLLISRFHCKKCKQNKNYRCTHNTSELAKLGFNDETIRFIQDVPLDNTGVPRPDSLVGVANRNIEFYLNNTFVHFAGASGYASAAAGKFNVQQFYKDKTDAFLKFINNLVQNP